ncbi:MAG: hypothetical protein V9E87_03090 [Gemmatimonadales bacterium]
MPTYTYQTLPSTPNAAPRRFEVKQSISDAPLTHDPESGEPVERVITGGRGPLTTITGGSEPTVTGGCGPSCGCH